MCTCCIALYIYITLALRLCPVATTLLPRPRLMCLNANERATLYHFLHRHMFMPDMRDADVRVSANGARETRHMGHNNTR